MLSAIELNAFPKSAINPTRSYVVSFTRVIPLSSSDSIAHVVCPTKSLNTFPSSSYTTRRGGVRVFSAFVVVVVVAPSLSPMVAIARVTRARIGVTARLARRRAPSPSPSVASSPLDNPRRRRFAFARAFATRADADARADVDVDADVDASPPRRPIAPHCRVDAGR